MAKGILGFPYGCGWSMGWCLGIDVSKSHGGKSLRCTDFDDEVVVPASCHLLHSG